MFSPNSLAKALNASIATHAFSGVISARQHGRVLYERAAGCADRSNLGANTLETRFGLASGTKFFTALAIGKLIAAQKLTLTTRLKDCVTLNFPHYAPEITIQHLLTHTSGIPDYLDEEKITDFDNVTLGRPYYELLGPRDYLAVFPDEPMKFTPGARFSYSNGGYILLGVVIEAVTGQRYQTFVEQEIFQPSGMHCSGFFALNQLPEKTAQGYVEDKAGGWRTNIYNLPIVGASDGGAFSTVGDLAQLWQAFWTHKILPKDLVAIFATRYMRAESEGENVFYGHGLWLADRPNGQREAYILGGDAGVSFKSGFILDDDLQYTVISNTSHGAWPIVRELDAVLNALPSLSPR